MLALACCRFSTVVKFWKTHGGVSRHVYDHQDFVVGYKAHIYCKASREDAFLNDVNWWENPLLCFTSDHIIPCWSPTSLGEIKFNVDSATSVGSTDCGGVLRTSEGEVGAMFSGPVPIFVAGSAEVYAIKAMLTVFIVLVI
ncbi:hypothetical protein V6N13_101442 [Hibiscus sabdariffa]